MKKFKTLISTKTSPGSLHFITALRFEAEYANTIRGGHLPMYLGQEKRKRLVIGENLLKNTETHELITAGGIIIN